MNNSQPRRLTNGVFNVILAGSGAILLFFLLTEHTAHFFGILPWLFLLACPFMHIFMHHGGHDRGSAHEDDTVREARHDRQHEETSSDDSPRRAKANTTSPDPGTGDAQDNNKEHQHHHGC